MIEIPFVILQLIIFLIIFSYPINKFNYSRLLLKNYSNLYFIYSLNIIIHLNIYLIVSFISVNIEYFFYLELILFLLFIFFYKKEYLKIIKKINYTELKFYIFFLFINLIFFFYNCREYKIRMGWISSLDI